MVGESQTASTHPAPARSQISLGALWFGICGVPLAWISLELVSYVLTSDMCTADSSLAVQTQADSVWHYLLPISLLAGMTALVATAVAVHNWRKTRDEKAGSAHHLLEVGEGRTRFMAMFGLLCSCGFLIAFLFSAAMLLLVPLCK